MTALILQVFCTAKHFSFLFTLFLHLHRVYTGGDRNGVTPLQIESVCTGSDDQIKMLTNHKLVTCRFQGRLKVTFKKSIECKMLLFSTKIPL